MLGEGAEGASDGEHSSQHGDDTGEGSGNVESRYVPREQFDDLAAKIDMLTDNFSEIRGALAQRIASQAPVVEEEDLNDDEPLTASKVAKIVAKQTSAATQAQAAKAERQEWDRKAAAEFPLTDPKFQLEFKRRWKELTDSGMDPKHPRALYQAAKVAAQLMADRKQPTTKRNDSDGDHDDSEAPSSARQASASRRKSTIEDGDPRVALYKMKGNKTAAQIAAFKDKLAAQDARRERRSR
jgi:hypothetical protein